MRTVLTITDTELHPGPGAEDVLVVGPSLGTAVGPLWAACAERLGGRFRVVGWDLPGHGRSKPASEPFEFADLARAVADLVRDADADSYARVCEALAAHDVRRRLAEVTVPLLAIAGAADVVTPPALAEEVAAGVPNGRVAVVDGAAHLAPAERPDAVAELLLSVVDRSDR